MNIKALIADDSRFMRLILVRILNSVGIWDVVEARDGEEAIRLFSRYPFDLVLTDCNMPGKSGLDVIQAIRSTGSSVPIVMLTSETEEANAISAFRAGATDYLVKPLPADKLRARLGRYLGAPVA